VNVRVFSKLALACAAAASLAAGALAARAAEPAYPSRSIQWVVPFAAGGSLDGNARRIGVELAKGLGQQIIVDNKVGAGGTIAADYVTKAKADGHTLLLGNVALLTIAPALYKLNFDPQKALAPVSLIVKNPLVIWTSAAMPGNNFAEFLAAAKARPNGYNFASPGSGTLNHLCAEMLQQAAGFQMTHVPYKGGAPAIVDMLGGRAHAFCEVYSLGAPHVASGKLKPLAVTTATRHPLLPNVPTLIELGYKDLEITGWQGVLVPAQTPPEIISRLAGEIGRVVNSPENKAWVEQQGSLAVSSTPEEMRKLIATERERWEKLIKATGIKVD
jgi:tripartite-type tricarboxylate transporter receptor subunit TctC